MFDYKNRGSFIAGSLIFLFCGYLTQFERNTAMRELIILYIHKIVLLSDVSRKDLLELPPRNSFIKLPPKIKNQNPPSLLVLSTMKHEQRPSPFRSPPILFVIVRRAPQKNPQHAILNGFRCAIGMPSITKNPCLNDVKGRYSRNQRGIFAELP